MQRIDYAGAAPGVYDAMDALDRYIAESPVEPDLLHLVRLRTSQLNGCAYCLDMHWKDLRALGWGANERRLYSLDAWRECPWYSDRERAALAWAEEVTLIAERRVPDEAFEAVRHHFNDRELADLTLAVAAVNAWNRLSIAARLVPGGYQAAVAAA